MDVLHKKEPALLPTLPLSSPRVFWQRWGSALKEVLPLYIAIHVAFFVISCLSILFVVRDFQWAAVPLRTLWQAWRRWDSGHYVGIALHGYQQPYHTAFFPLFPILERALSIILTRGDPFIAGLIISDVATLVLLVVLYQLVSEDFDAERAAHAILY
ncbi:MAG TPA: hypothetical protein VGT82_14110, partial [Ktedonobacteraceae bacterium]|nr:hypothetical protein [Ktedonobacteraceae bacterium]